MNYIRVNAWNVWDTANALFYTMEDGDKAEITEAQFGDRVYIITTKKTYVMGNDKVWYEM